MKAIIVHCDGMASPTAPFSETTPLAKAATPNLDWLANHGDFGAFALPSGSELISDVTHLALLGYDPQKFYSGPAPFEAVSLDVHLDKGDVAFLGQLVTLRSVGGRGDEKKLGPQIILDDDQAGGIDTEEARELIDGLNDQLASEIIQFYAGKRHRHLMVWVGGTGRYGCSNPRLALGKSVDGFLPKGEGAKFVLELMEASRIVLRHHPVNEERVQAGLKPANCLWLWGPGKAMELPVFTERYGLSGVTLSPDTLHVGVGLSVGFSLAQDVEEWNWDGPDYRSIAESCFTWLRTKDVVYLHFPMNGSSAGGMGDLIEIIERFDDQVIGPLLAALRDQPDLRVLIASNPPVTDGASFTATVAPYVMCRHPMKQSDGRRTVFHELAASRQYGGVPREATKLIERLLARE
ncbi:MAG: phosphoglycerate mutase [Nitrospirae bacterium]|nr:MAG: phosphoglycerate mutase [Nitrospirota bacterium]